MTKEQREKVMAEFVNGFIQYMNDNPDTFDEFAEAWFNADNKTVRDIVDDYIMELEAQF